MKLFDILKGKLSGKSREQVSSNRQALPLEGEYQPAGNSFWEEARRSPFDIMAFLEDGDYDRARLGLQKIAYMVHMEREKKPDLVRDFTSLMCQFTRIDPLYNHCIAIILPLIAQNPGVRQTELYPHMPVDTETARYVLYFAHETGNLHRVKSGNSYRVYLAKPQESIPAAPAKMPKSNPKLKSNTTTRADIHFCLSEISDDSTEPNQFSQLIGGWEDFFSAAFLEVMSEVNIPEKKKKKLPKLCKALARMEGSGPDDLAEVIMEHLGDDWTWQLGWDMLKVDAERSRQEEIQAIRGYDICDFLSGMKVQDLRKLYAEYAPRGEKTFRAKGEGGKTTSRDTKIAIIPAILALIPAETQEMLLKQWKLDALKYLREPVKIEAEDMVEYLALRLQKIAWAKFRYSQLTEPAALSALPYWKFVFYDLGGRYDSGSHDHHEQWDGMALRNDHPFWKTHFPPNGWGCSCYITGIGKPSQDIRTEPPQGWNSIDPKTGLPIGIDKGWVFSLT